MKNILEIKVSTRPGKKSLSNQKRRENQKQRNQQPMHQTTGRISTKCPQRAKLAIADHARRDLGTAQRLCHLSGVKDGDAFNSMSMVSCEKLRSQTFCPKVLRKTE